MSTSETHAWRYVRFFLLAALVAIILPALLTYSVDPLGLYGSPLKLSLNWQLRSLKAELLAEAEPPPQALILGSSWMRNIDPLEIEQHFGLRAFNAGVNNGLFPDFLGFTRLAVEGCGHPIELIIVGIDPGSFVSGTILHDHAVHVPELRRYLPDPHWSFLRSRRLMWSYLQLNESRRVLFSRAGELARRWGLRGESGESVDEESGRPEPSEWRSDGFDHNLRGRDRSQGADLIIGNRLLFYANQTGVRSQHLRDWELLLDYARTHEIRVLSFVTVPHPELTAALAGTKAEAIRAEAAALCAERSGGNVLFCNLNDTVFDWDDYEDYHHPGKSTSSRVVDLLATCNEGQD